MALAEHVLVVDDEIKITEITAELLSGEGFQCETAASGTEALQRVLENDAIGVVVTDIRMPGMDGIELTRQIKLQLPPSRDVRVIIMSGQAGMPEAIEALLLNAITFLRKPIEPGELFKSVCKAQAKIRQSFRRKLQRLLDEGLNERTLEVLRSSYALRNNRKATGWSK